MKKDIFKKLLIIFLIIQPLFDTVYTFNKVFTLLRLLMIIFLGTWLYIEKKESRYAFRFLLYYYILIAIYFVALSLHSTNFSGIFPLNIYYDYRSEALTLIKLSLPFLLFIIFKFSNFEKKDYFKIVNAYTLLIPLSIVILNIFGYSYSSYSNEVTNISIFDWPSSVSYVDAATKGVFVYANQTTVITLILLIMNYLGYIYNSHKYLISIIITSFALIMLGTRLSTYGGLIILIFLSIGHIIYTIIIKKINIKYDFILLLISLGWYLFLPYTPNNLRVSEIVDSKNNIESVTPVVENNVSYEIDSTDTDIEITSKNYSLQEFVDNNIDKSLIPEMFYKDYYSYDYDPDFWVDITNKQKTEYIDYRKLEILIFKRVKYINNNINDTLFGLSNSRIQSIVNIEKDFVLHYYAYGIIGSTLLLLYYVFIFIFTILQFLKEKAFENFAVLLIVMVYIGCSYFSGNILNFLTPMIPFVFFSTYKFSSKD